MRPAAPRPRRVLLVVSDIRDTLRNRDSIEKRRLIDSDSDRDVKAVVKGQLREADVAAQSRFVETDVASIGIRCSDACKAAQDGHPVEKRETRLVRL